VIKRPGDEHALLGILLYGRSPDDVAGVIEPHDFTEPRLETIYRTILAVHDAQVEVNPITVWDHLPPLRRGIDAAYLHDLMEVAGVDPMFYAQRIAEAARWRGLEAFSIRLAQMAREKVVTINEAEEQAAEWVSALATGDVSEAVPIGDVYREVVEVAERGVSAGLPTRWPEIDKLIGGWYPGGLTVVGARPSVGKSLFLSCAALWAAVHQGIPVYFASVEMSRFEMVQRFLADLTGVKLSKLRAEDARLTEDEWQRVAECRQTLHDMPLWIVDDAGQTVADIRAGARRMAAHYGRAPLVMVDYLQLLPASGQDRRDRRDLEVAADSRALKRLARDLGTNVLLASQLNRDAANREPTLANLRESGAIEQDADVVILLHKPDSDDRPDDGLTQVIIAKHRTGPTGRCELIRQGWWSRIVSRSELRR
jgi:replicative DNA helicase